MYSGEDTQTITPRKNTVIKFLTYLIMLGALYWITVGDIPKRATTMDQIDRELYEIIDNHTPADDNPTQRSLTRRWMWIIIGFALGIGYQILMYVIIQHNGY